MGANIKNEKLVTLPELQSIIFDSPGKKVVWTNGCFDVLHVGHVKYLQQARDLGDFLVIGLNSDDSVSRLKGKDRPLNDQEDRAFLLAGLSCVDYIVIFEEDTPFDILSVVRPDILVKGSDYSKDSVIGREFSKEVVLIDFVNGYSTTRTISKIRNSVPE